MKNSEVYFRLIGDSGPVSIYWYDAPYGEAIESLNENGVGWFSPTNDLLGVEFDDVNEASDKQDLEFSNGAKVSIEAKDGKITILKSISGNQQAS